MISRPTLTLKGIGTILICLITSVLQAQISPKDSAIRVTMIMINGGLHLPGADMAKRFGTNANAGASYLIKFKKGVMLSYSIDYIFGQTVKEPNLLQNLLTQPDSSGNQYVINKAGALSDPRVWQRGLVSHFSVGKLFWRTAPNDNSGFFITVGGGFMMHKIRIQDIGNYVPQLAKSNLSGYDRLTAGFSTREFIGYMYLHNKRRLSFFAGLEFIQGFTKSLRKYNYDTRSYDTTNRIDLLNGFKLGVIIPLYKKVPNTFYYY